ncbi:16S rRNA (cytosine(967)-C(5))-methyltransferase RsmB, partial [Salmonella sp. hn-h4]|nr:16S rRNA (cytosine(967)-C(5))-methyltransferase RsmB [Salmonella sp. hn-h4]
WQPELARADRVLCDVPCSGLGILRKKPDLRYKTLGELPSLCVLQAKILATASRYVKEGGRLVYSTCTLNPQENEYQIEQFLAGEE